MCGLRFISCEYPDLPAAAAFDFNLPCNKDSLAQELAANAPVFPRH